MTKPSEEFKKWLDIVVEDNFNFAKNPPIDWPHISWLAYLEGRDDRPVVVPEIIVQKERFAAYRCPDCLQGAIGRGFNYCDGCGAKLDWSKVK
jgi:hypothetical protein